MKKLEIEQMSKINGGWEMFALCSVLSVTGPYWLYTTLCLATFEPIAG